MGNLQDEIREIRKKLRLAMNGVTSTCMRERGVVYKLNFGVAYPEIKQIALGLEPSKDLARALWSEDVREFKILATFLFPIDEMSIEEAKRWVYEIPYLEIAEYSSRNLFVRLPYVNQLIVDLWNDQDNAYARTVAFLTTVESLKRGIELTSVTLSAILKESFDTLGGNETYALREKQAALSALKFYGRQSKERAGEVLRLFDVFMKSKEETPEIQELYNDLKFEFEYYL